MERRKYPRYVDNSPVTFLVETATVRGEGRIENISLEGAAILSDATVSRGEYIAVTITVPNSARTIEVELAPVRWVRPGKFGVEFIRVAQDSQQRLKEYIKHLESTSVEAA
jgi:hypothetical protein